MDVKKSINSILKIFGKRLISVSRVGVDVFNEIEHTGLVLQCVLDVGANVGQSSSVYLNQFPRAQVHAFEPVSNNFKQLSMLAHSRLKVNRMAIGAEEGFAKIYLSENAGMHSMIVAESKERFETVKLTTVQNYCKENEIDRIGLLKIDTEGSDLEVLQGAKNLLENSQIDFVQVETAFRKKDRHVHLCNFLSFLSQFDYYLLGIYDQELEWDGRSRIQYANALFARSGIKTRSKRAHN